MHVLLFKASIISANLGISSLRLRVRYLPPGIQRGVALTRTYSFFSCNPYGPNVVIRNYAKTLAVCEIRDNRLVQYVNIWRQFLQKISIICHFYMEELILNFTY